MSVGPRWLVCVFMVVAGWAQGASAQTMTIAWDPNPDPSVVGYVVYAGTQSGEYTAEFDVGSATSFVYNAVAEQPYFFAVASYAEGMIVGPLSAEVDGTAPSEIAAAPVDAPPPEDAPPAADASSPVDTTAPVVAITMPAMWSRTLTTDPFVTVGGTATDDNGVVAVTWTTNRGNSGTATGTDMWIAGIPLHTGRNDIIITAFDATGNAGTATVSIYRQTLTQ